MTKTPAIIADIMAHIASFSSSATEVSEGKAAYCVLRALKNHHKRTSCKCSLVHGRGLHFWYHNG